MAEGVGSALLVSAVVGSGIMGERLAGGNDGLALLANSLATGAALVALILSLGPISGAHFNPVVTLTDAWNAGTRWSEVPAYVTAQISGSIFGVCMANAMFGESLTWSRNSRGGWPLLLGELVATFGLIAVIRGCAKRESSAVAYAVAAYITAAYWFTSSTSFANPAVTLARSLTDTFSGIRPGDVPGFITAQCVGAAAAAILFRWLVPGRLSVMPESKESESDGTRHLRVSS